jgi:two-component system nitrate/nitrite response regulator NarL
MNAIPKLAASPIRVLLVGGCTVGRTGLRLLINSQPGLTVTGEAATALDMRSAACEQFDVVLFDFDRSNDAEVDYMPELTEVASRARVLILTYARDPEIHLRAMQIGVMGLVLKEEPTEILVEAIQKVHAGEVWFARSMMPGLLGQVFRKRTTAQTNPEAAKIATLTDREREVVALIGEGLKNKQLAERLFISETTVRHHLTSIFDKLGVSDRLELVIYAYKHGLAKPPW